MATETLVLSSVGTPDGWILAAGSSKVAACQTPDDDLSSYIRSTTTTGNNQRFVLSDSVNIRARDTINHVTVRIRHRRAGAPAGNIRSFLAIGSDIINGALVTTGASWLDQTVQYNDAPGSTGWTLEQVNALEVGIVNGQNRDVYCTTIEVVVNYTPDTSPTEVDLMRSVISDAGVIAVQHNIDNLRLTDAIWTLPVNMGGRLRIWNAASVLVFDSDLNGEGAQSIDGVPAWAVGIAYAVDDVVSYEGELYRVIQAHTSQEDWPPPVVPALFVLTTPPGVIPAWVQPTGAHDAYALGAVVLHNGHLWESTIDANVWPPPTDGLWLDLGEYTFLQWSDELQVYDLPDGWTHMMQMWTGTDVTG
jgi:hypothetical protein